MKGVDLDSTRYQDSPWYTRLWRRRHYIPIPYYAVKSWWYNRHDEDNFSLAGWYSLEIGIAQARMNWLYDMEDLKIDFSLPPAEKEELSRPKVDFMNPPF